MYDGIMSVKYSKLVDNLNHGVETFYDKVPYQLLWAGSQGLRAKITITGLPNRPNYCVIFRVYTFLILIHLR